MQERNTHYCSNCQITIPNDSEYQAHYRSDFHRYNIRRRLMNLDSVSFEVFQKKFLESQSNTSCSSSLAQTYSCTTCKKSFGSSGTYSQHLNSAKHKQVLKERTKHTTDTQKSQTEILPEKCLFCESSTDDLSTLYTHMNSEHGFFIREKESLVDTRGLIDSLRQIIEKQFYCLSCPCMFASADSAKQHMLDKGHCFMPHEHYDQLCHFYDFSKKMKELLNIGDIIELDDQSIEEILELESQNSRISEFEFVQLTPEQQQRRQSFMHYLDQIMQNKAKVLPNGEIQLPNGKMYQYTKLALDIEFIENSMSKVMLCHYQKRIITYLQDMSSSALFRISEYNNQMQNNQVLDELESYLEQQKSNNSLRIEVRLGTIIPKNKEAIQDLLYFQDACVNVESKIEKKNYRFEAAIGKEDFEKASKVIKSDDRWEFTLDIIFPISYMVSISYRIGLDEEGKVFCYERKKELKAKHLDVMDQSRQYRISLSQFENADYYQTAVCVEKIRDLLKNQKEIGCIRFKQTKIYYHDDESEQFVFQVQQVEKLKQAFLVEIAQNIVNDNNTFRKNVDNALNMFKDQAYYFKPFYEAEISLKQNKIAQSSAVLAEKYLEKIRQFHDNVRLMNPKIALSGLKDQQKQPEPNFNQQKGTRGNQPRTRGNNRPENDRQDNSNQILQDLAGDSQPKQFQQQQQNNYRGRGGRGGRGRGQAFHKDREDNDDDERYQSRTEDYL